MSAFPASQRIDIYDNGGIAPIADRKRTAEQIAQLGSQRNASRLMIVVVRRTNDDLKPVGIDRQFGNSHGQGH